MLAYVDQNDLYRRCLVRDCLRRACGNIFFVLFSRRYSRVSSFVFFCVGHAQHSPITREVLTKKKKKTKGTKKIEEKFGGRNLINNR